MVSFNFFLFWYILKLDLEVGLDFDLFSLEAGERQDCFVGGDKFFSIYDVKVFFVLFCFFLFFFFFGEVSDHWCAVCE